MNHYDPVAKTLHWLVFILLAIEFAVALTMPDIKRGEAPTAQVNFHISMGIIILFVVLVRIAWRLKHPAPKLPRTMSRRDRALALTMHIALYGALLAMPLTGWVWASAKGWEVTLFNFFTLPALVEKGAAISKVARTIHASLSTIILVAVGVHIIAALHHHYVRKNDILTRILPVRWGNKL